MVYPYPGGCSFGGVVTADPMLMPLPASPDATSTRALAPGSSAINAGSQSGCANLLGPLVTTDQHGLPRPVNACDLGAFEFQTPVLAGVPTVSGIPEVGQTVTCNSPAVSSPDGPVASQLAWSRDGVAVATGASYAVVAADVGHALSCRLTVTNAAGSVDATSAAVLARAATAVAQCIVPALKRLKLPATRRKLAAANCALGKVKKPKHRQKGDKLVVSRQSGPPKATLDAGAKISVKLVVKKKK